MAISRPSCIMLVIDVCVRSIGVGRFVLVWMQRGVDCQAVVRVSGHGKSLPVLSSSGMRQHGVYVVIVARVLGHGQNLPVVRSSSMCGESGVIGLLPLWQGWSLSWSSGQWLTMYPCVPVLEVQMLCYG